MRRGADAGDASARGAAGAPDADPELVTRLRVAVGRIARQLRQHNAGGLTVSQLSALFAIEHRGSVRLGDLAAIEGVAPSTLSRIVGTLDEAGLVRREPDPDDRRSAWISLAPEGHRVLSELRTERTLLLARRVAALDRGARRALEAALPALEQLAGETGEPAAARGPAKAGDRPADDPADAVSDGRASR